MKVLPSVPRGCGLFVTPRGSEASREPESCKCDLALVNLTIACTKCGTVYAVYSSQALKNRGDWL